MIDLIRKLRIIKMLIKKLEYLLEKYLLILNLKLFRNLWSFLFFRN